MPVEDQRSATRHGDTGESTYGKVMTITTTFATEIEAADGATDVFRAVDLVLMESFIVFEVLVAHPTVVVISMLVFAQIFVGLET